MRKNTRNEYTNRAKKLGVTLEYLSKRIGVSYNRVVNILHGKIKDAENELNQLDLVLIELEEKENDLKGFKPRTLKRKHK